MGHPSQELEGKEAQLRQSPVVSLWEHSKVGRTESESGGEDAKHTAHLAES